MLICELCSVFFFFKQKTAYEMRISDWSSDVCSSDLLGLIYGPSADFTLKASWGRSFKAPTLFQRYWDRQAVLYPAALLGGADYPAGSTALPWGGGNPDLDPERARTWAAALAYHPEALSGLEMELPDRSTDIKCKGLCEVLDCAGPSSYKQKKI